MYIQKKYPASPCKFSCVHLGSLMEMWCQVLCLCNGHGVTRGVCGLPRSGCALVYGSVLPTKSHLHSLSPQPKITLKPMRLVGNVSEPKTSPIKNRLKLSMRMKRNELWGCGIDVCVENEQISAVEEAPLTYWFAKGTCRNRLSKSGTT